MDCLKMVKCEIDKGWTGPNPDCKFGPCHYEGQDCTYCFCPFHPCGDEDLGEYIDTPNGKYWSCVYCHFIHRIPVCRFIASRITELRIREPDDPRLRGLLTEAKERFMVPGKAIMVLGATSDAGKSLITAALCRIISRKGYSVTPMKTQNMSLNSMIASDGSEVASIQMVQAKAARIRHPDRNVNPILIKPMGSGKTQTIVHGKIFGEFGVNEYYEDFIPSKGTEAVRESIRLQKDRYEYVVMEGAGSPAEINIYHRDIANMRAAEMADADCILVVNMKWGGAFAYALGTVELLADDDRKRVKGIIFNNMHGDASSLDSGIKEIESILGIPVLGVVPHLDLPMPAEDSMTMNRSEGKEGKINVIVLKLPKIANFTDLDPLYHENVHIKYTEDPRDLYDADVIIIPGTKDIKASVEWMRSSGMDVSVIAMKGKVPIVGICGGYQIMCASFSGTGAPCAGGLGLFDATVKWTGNEETKRQVKGKLALTGEDMKGYEAYSGCTETNAQPLFTLSFFKSPSVNEGSADVGEKLFGTYVHGLFDEPGFRRHILKMTGKYVPSGYSDVSYDKILDETLDKLADAVGSSIDMNAFNKMLEVCR
ncbi:MAG: cobyric acid synthase [Methanomassiliicoccaceae archaeon]|nr:cobyric acid synthase [Methanomassiliicoccaceae archaeon]